MVSIVTPTWHRREKLLNRCVPSVLAQTYPQVEHVIVSDGPDRELDALIPDDRRISFAQLPEHDPHARWGHWARLRGIELAEGDLIGYCDDDDYLDPGHVAALVQALVDHPEAGFAYSRARLNGSVIGCDPPAYCNIGTPQMFHRRSILGQATWEQSQPTIDWDLVNRWMQAGISWAYVPQETCEIFPSGVGS